MERLPRVVVSTVILDEKPSPMRIYGTCQVEGCDRRAVAYYDRIEWNLCSYHAVLYIGRSRFVRRDLGPL